MRSVRSRRARRRGKRLEQPDAVNQSTAGEFAAAVIDDDAAGGSTRWARSCEFLGHKRRVPRKAIRVLHRGLGRVGNSAFGEDVPVAPPGRADRLPRSTRRARSWYRPSGISRPPRKRQDRQASGQRMVRRAPAKSSTRRLVSGYGCSLSAGVLGRRWGGAAGSPVCVSRVLMYTSLRARAPAVRRCRHGGAFSTSRAADHGCRSRGEQGRRGRRRAPQTSCQTTGAAPLSVGR